MNRGVSTTKNVPSSVPAVDPAPPMSKMAMNSTDRMRSHTSGGSCPAKDARSAPATPAKNDDRAKAIVLYLVSGTPMISAATSRSRMAWRARPVRVRMRFLETRIVNPSRTRQKRYVFWVPRDVEPEPVTVVGERDDRVLFLPELELERREVASDLLPAGELGEHPPQVQPDEHQPHRGDTEIEPTHADRRRGDEDADECGDEAGTRQPDPHRQAVAPLLALRLATEEDGGVGADAHEEGVTQRHLTGDAGEQVEAEGGDGEDHRLGGEPQPVGVAEESEERQLVDHGQVEREQYHHRGERRHGDPLRPGRQQTGLGRVARVQVRTSAHRQTRLISLVPNRPYGLTNSTPSMMMYGTTSW